MVRKLHWRMKRRKFKVTSILQSLSWKFKFMPHLVDEHHWHSIKITQTLPEIFIHSQQALIDFCFWRFPLHIGENLHDALFSNCVSTIVCAWYQVIRWYLVSYQNRLPCYKPLLRFDWVYAAKKLHAMNQINHHTTGTMVWWFIWSKADPAQFPMPASISNRFPQSSWII